MQRREALLFLGAAAVAPFAARLSAEERWSAASQLHGRLTPAGRALNAAQSSQVAALADAILPRTDTPGALDANVPQFVDLLIAEWYPDQDRRELLGGLDTLDALCRAAHGRPFAELDGAGRAAFLDTVEHDSRPEGSPQAAYAKLKEAIVFGYVTSPSVGPGLLLSPIIPGRFDGCIPLDLAHP